MMTRQLRCPFFTAAVVMTLAAISIGQTSAKDRAEKKTHEVKVDGLTLTVPESWKQLQPKSKFRKAQFETPAAEGDKEGGEVVLFYFGGGGGGVDQNIKRWIGQFKSTGRKLRLTQGKASQGKYVLVDLRGTYNKPIGPPIQRKTKPTPGSRMLGVILSVQDKGNYFLKFTGPEKTVAAAAADFRKSIGAPPKKSADTKKKTAAQ